MVGYSSPVSGGERRWLLSDLIGLTSNTITSLIPPGGELGVMGNVNASGTAMFSRIGVGVTPDANNIIEAIGQTALSRRIAAFKYFASDNNGALFSLRKGRGTYAVPVPLNSGDELASVGFEGFFNNANPTDDAGASISAVTTEAWTGTTARGAYLAFSTILSGTNTIGERMRISGNGNLLVGTSTGVGLTGSGGAKINSATAASNTISGALVVNGGVGANANSWFTNVGITGVVNIGGVTTTGVTGTGKIVLDTAPTLVTPALGTPTGGLLSACTGLPVSTGISGLGANVANFLTSPNSALLAAALTDETGTGNVVFSNSATLYSPSINGTASFIGTGGTIDVPTGDANISTSGGGTITISANTKITGTVKDQNASAGTSGQVLKTDGTGKLTYSNVTGAYILHLGAAGTATFTSNSTRYIGPTLVDVGPLANQGRYKTYFPRNSVIKSVQYIAFGGGGSGAQNLTWDLWLNNNTSVAQVNYQSNVFPMGNVISNLSNSVTTSDYIELRINNPSAGANVTGFTCAALIYLETVL